MLLALGRGDINKESLGNKRKITTDKKRHSFFMAFSDIVAFGVRENASDIHFNLDFQNSYSQVMFTINGRYVSIEKYRMATPTMLQILNVAWMAGAGGNGSYFDTRIEQQCRVNLDVEKQSIMLRWASVSCEYPGPSVTMRIVKLNQQGKIPSLEDLSYLPDQVATFERAMNSEKGAIIMVGVVGSGKSYTIASLMSRLPAHRKKMGAEDPVEIIIPGMLQKSINRALEGDTGKEFEAFGKTIKRSAMNDVLLGEIRDPSTGAFFVDVVLMGTSFYTTTHAPSALGALR
ncbi:Flp pilus assembly complex ATPase component TadA (plasmid) [Polaromonas sp. P1-6]|nr:Flp pilus assembly complex ATPase component TadA [Polaromonas sp. P1-6]